MATIKSYKSKNGQTLYEFRVYAGMDQLTGKKQYIHRRGYENKKAATLAASKATLDANQPGRKIFSSRLTFKDVYQEWDEGYRNTVREATYYTIQSTLNKHILPAFGSKRITQITPVMIQRVVNQWAETSKVSYSFWLSTVKRILNYAERSGYIASNPARLVVKPKSKVKEQKSFENFWDKTELAQFFNAIDENEFPEQLAFFRVLAFGGLRRGEAAALTWADISFSDSSIDINKTVSKGMHARTRIEETKTRAGMRVIKMDSKTMRALSSWHVKELALFMSKGINANRPGQLVFPSSNNRILHTNTADQWLKNVTERAKMNHPITMHGFRHSHASALFASGASIKEVQQRLGHSDVKTTMDVYTHVSKEQTEHTSDKLAAYLGF
ncbi:tyrosine-type recombinase/integrase [Lacticaseibacillus songhuajiangensis]|uniref:tyrosine-type recombinase/integrase n=1 Tax=Lacticaseibacillus songhuajiangensis TaxID=1296539 RepID=UPI000F77487B|nr:site-specific integrase [Lacticaseibacillus songhuajiangensis]